MDYILVDYPFLTIKDGKREIKIEESIISYLKKRATEHLFSLDGYFQAVKKVFPFKSCIPIYFSNRLLLFPVFGFRREKNYLVNYFAIRGVEDSFGKTKIYFENEYIIVDKGIKEVKIIIQKTEAILEYIKKVK